jgi:hypothetical protein
MGQKAFDWVVAIVVGGAAVGLVIVALVGTLTNWWIDSKGDD